MNIYSQLKTFQVWTHYQHYKQDINERIQNGCQINIFFPFLIIGNYSTCQLLFSSLFCITLPLLACAKKNRNHLFKTLIAALPFSHNRLSWRILSHQFPSVAYHDCTLHTIITQLITYFFPLSISLPTSVYSKAMINLHFATNLLTFYF